MYRSASRNPADPAHKMDRFSEAWPIRAIAPTNEIVTGSDIVFAESSNLVLLRTAPTDPCSRQSGSSAGPRIGDRFWEQSAVAPALPAQYRGRPPSQVAHVREGPPT